MRLADGLRQTLAGALAAFGFLALYLGAGLAWWLSLLLGAAVYAAILLLVRRRPSASEIMVAERVSAADLDAAAASLHAASRRLAATAERLPEAERGEIAAIAAHVDSIRAQILADPRDLRPTRSFIGFHLPKIVETVEGYAALAERAGGGQAERLAELGRRIRGFRPVVARIERACLENDFAALETSVAALATQMERV